MKKSDQTSCVLICGNTKLLDLETLKLISQYYNVILSGDNDLIEDKPKRFSKKLHVYKYNITSEEFSRLAFSFSPDAIWYISGFADGGEGLENEQKMVERLINVCIVNEVSKLVFVSSINSLYYEVNNLTSEKSYKSVQSFSCAQLEEYVNYIAKENCIKTIMLRLPYIALKDNHNTYLGSVFSQIDDEGKILFPYRDDQIIDFISSANFAELLIAVTEESIDQTDAYTISSGFENTYKDFADMLFRCKSNIQVSYDDNYHDLIFNPKTE